MKLAKFLALPVIALTCMTLSFASCDGNKTESTASDADTTAVADSAAAKSTSTYKFRPGKKVSGKLIALTFDDGPNHKATPKILATLQKYGAHATFFCVGQDINSGTIPLMKRSVEYGNEICSHTYSHPFLSMLTPEQINEEISKTNELIKNAVGYYPNFFRPPYIDVDQGVLDCIDLPAHSGSGSGDWKTSQTPEMIYQTVMKKARPNAVFVMHDLGANTRTPIAVEKIIPALQAQGYTLVTLTDLYTSLGITPQPGKLYLDPKKESPFPPTKRERTAKSGAKSGSTDSASKTAASTKTATPVKSSAAPVKNNAAPVKNNAAPVKNNAAAAKKKAVPAKSVPTKAEPVKAEPVNAATPATQETPAAPATPSTPATSTTTVTTDQ